MHVEELKFSSIHQRCNTPWLSRENDTGTWAPFHDQDKTKPEEQFMSLCLRTESSEHIFFYLFWINKSPDTIVLGREVNEGE